MTSERRSGDNNVIELKTQFKDFMDRYQRDQSEAQSWRIDTTQRLKVHCDFINEVSPIYKTLCKVLGIVAIASLGIAVAAFWAHITWK